MIASSRGTALAAGDFNANGRDDLAIGIPGDERSFYTVLGSVNVLYGESPSSGNPGGLTASSNQLWNRVDYNLLVPADFLQNFGASLAAGDFNDDGYDDLVVGVYRENSYTGIVYFFYGASGGINPVDNQSIMQ